jgi:hypothetical protein
VIGKIEIIASIITHFSNGSFFCEEEEEESKLKQISTAWEFWTNRRCCLTFSLRDL